MNTVSLATADRDLGLVPAKAAKVTAQGLANTQGKPVTLRHPVTDKVLATVKPKAKATAKPTTSRAKVAKPKAPKAKPAPTATARAPKAKQPKGMVVDILKLASRAKGVSPAELNELTKWKGAPWKWLFSNPKKTGYCDRWGYTFRVNQMDDGVRYHVTKK